jgi:hypothetical protein
VSHAEDSMKKVSFMPWLADSRIAELAICDCKLNASSGGRQVGELRVAHAPIGWPARIADQGVSVPCRDSESAKRLK